jgi:hypothetical protein
MIGETTADRHHFPMSSRITGRSCNIVALCKNLPAAHDYGAKWGITLPGFIERNTHEPFIVT